MTAIFAVDYETTRKKCNAYIYLQEHKQFTDALHNQ